MKNLESIFQLTGYDRHKTAKNIKKEVYSNCYIPKGTILSVFYKENKKEGKKSNCLYYFDYDIEFEKIMSNKDFTKNNTIDNFSLIGEDIAVSIGDTIKASIFAERYIVKIYDTCQIRERLEFHYYDNISKYPSRSKFPEDYVFDEDKSVKWNKEEVKRQNELIQKEKEYYIEKSQKLQEEFENDCINSICSGYTKINKKQASLIFNYAYRKSHSGGYYNVLSTLEELEELINSILECK